MMTQNLLVGTKRVYNGISPKKSDVVAPSLVNWELVPYQFTDLTEHFRCYPSWEECYLLAFVSWPP